ncbi:MAG: Ig-like domain-containing protein [Mycobacterium sp.]
MAGQNSRSKSTRRRARARRNSRTAAAFFALGMSVAAPQALGIAGAAPVDDAPSADNAANNAAAKPASTSRGPARSPGVSAPARNEPDGPAPAATPAPTNTQSVTSASSASLSAAPPAVPLPRLIAGLLAPLQAVATAGTRPAPQSTSRASGNQTAVIVRPVTVPVVGYEQSENVQVGSTVAGTLSVTAPGGIWTLNGRPQWTPPASGPRRANSGVTSSQRGSGPAPVAPARGTVAFNPDGTFDYTPNAELAAAGGTDTFTVTVSDRSGRTVAVPVTVVVRKPAVPAINKPDPDTGTVSGRVTGGSGSGEENFTPLDAPQRGSVVVEPTTGEFSYIPSPEAQHAAAADDAEDADRTDTFTVSITDQSGTGTVVVPISVPIRPFNTLPQATAQVGAPDTVSGRVIGTVLGSDDDGDTLSYGAPAGTPRGTVTIDPATGTFTYTPTDEARHAAAADDAGDAERTDTFTVTIDDDHGGLTELAVTVVIAPANTTPTATASVGTPDRTGVVTGTVTGADADGDTLRYSAPPTTPRGTVRVDPETGVFTYTPGAAARASATDLTDTFTLTVNDGHGGTATVSVTVAIDPNRTPVAVVSVGSPDPATAVVTGTVTGSDPDGDAVSYSAPAATPKGTVSINPTTGAFTYTPGAAARHAAAADGASLADRTDTFTAAVSDGRGGVATVAVTVGIVGSNVAPTLAPTVGTPDAATGAVTGSAGGSDADGDSLSYSAPATTAKGSVLVDAASGAFAYTPAPAARHAAAAVGAFPANLFDTVTLTVTDGHGGVATVAVTVPIGPANVAPTAVVTTGTPNSSSGTVTGAVVGSDADGDTLTYSGPTSTARGTVTVNRDGTFVYTPDAAAAHAAAAAGAPGGGLADTFTVTVDDGHGGTATQVVSITIAPRNVTPTLNPTVSAPTAATGQITGGADGADADADTLSYAITSRPANGTVSIDPATGAFVYTPNAAARHAAALERPVTRGLQTVTLSDPAAVTQGTFALSTSTLNHVTQLASAGTNRFNYVATFFTATESRTYVFGQTSAPVDTVMIVYTGTFDPASPSRGAVAVNDDTPVTSHATVGATVQGPSGCGSTSYCPQVSADLTAGQVVTLVVTTYSAGAPLGLPQTFYSNGPGGFSPSSPEDSFTISVDDGHGGVTARSVSVPITPANTNPSATATPNAPDAAGLVTGTVAGSDADGDTLTYSAPASSTWGRGTVSINPTTGAFTFTPTEAARHAAARIGALPANSADTVTITVRDGYGGVTLVPVTVAIGSANNAPIASATPGRPNGSGVVNGTTTASDPDNDPLTFSGSTTTAKGTVVVNAATGAFTYTPTAAARHAAAANNAATTGALFDTFTLTVTDGFGGAAGVPVTVSIRPANRAPVLNPTVAAAIAGTGAISGLANGTDPDANTLTYSLSAGPTKGAVVLDAASGVFTYTPTPVARHNAAAIGAPAGDLSDSFTLAVSDGQGGTSTATVSVTVSPANVAPTGTFSTANTFANGGFTTNLTGWTAINSRVLLGGASNVAGWPTPVDPTNAPDGGIEASSLSVESYTTTVTDGRAVMTSSLGGVLNTPAGSGGVVHGPVIVSNDPVYITSGATVQFDWEASGGQDAYDVFAYILNVNTGATAIMLNATGPTFNASQPVTVVNFPIATAGNYKFVFVSGSWDATRGTAAGARLSIDNVRILNNWGVGAITGAVTGSDSDGDTLSYSLTTGPASGTVTVDATSGGFVYTPNNPNSPAADSFVVTVTDNYGGSVPVTVTVP